MDHKLGLYAEHGTDRARHAKIGKERGSLRQKLLIGGLHMRMCAKYRGHPAVQIIPHRTLFPGGLRMKIHQAYRRQVRVAENPVHGRKGAIEAVHVRGAHQVDHRYLHAAKVYHAHAVPGHAAGEIRGAQQGFALVVQLIAFFAAKAVIAGRDHIHPAGKQKFHRSGSDTVAVRGVFAVDNHQIDLPFLF